MSAHVVPRAPETWPTWVSWVVVALLVAATGAVAGLLIVGDAWESPWAVLGLVPVMIGHLLFRRHRLPIDPIS